MYPISAKMLRQDVYNLVSEFQEIADNCRRSKGEKFCLISHKKIGDSAEIWDRFFPSLGAGVSSVINACVWKAIVLSDV